jgi:hypothetical protein
LDGTLVERGEGRTLQRRSLFRQPASESGEAGEGLGLIWAAPMLSLDVSGIRFA